MKSFTRRSTRCTSIGVLNRSPITSRRLVVTAAGNKEQKNQGLYFSYEPVDKKQAEEEKVKVEEASNEFNWVKNARNNSFEHRERRAGGLDDGGPLSRPPPRSRPSRLPSSRATGTSSPPSSQNLPPGVQRPNLPPRPTLRSQQAATPPKAPTSSASSPLESPPPPPSSGPVRVQKAGSSTTLPPPPAPSSEASSKISSRKSSLMNRMTSKQPSSPSPSPLREPSPSPLSESLSLGLDLEKIPSVPSDLVDLDDDEQDIRDMLQSLFVDDPSLSLSFSGSQFTTTTFGREAKAQEEFKSWVSELSASRGISSDDGTSGDGMNPNISLDLPNISQYMKTAAEDLEGFSQLASQISSEEELEDQGEELNLDLDIDGGVVDEEAMLARLKVTDPVTYELLMSTLTSKEDEEILKMLSSFGGGEEMDDEIDDKELEMILKNESLNQGSADEDRLWGEEEEEEGDGGLEDIVSAIEEDTELSEEERRKATFGIASIFNAAAEEASAADGKATGEKKNKGRGDDPEPFDPTFRGPTTTGRERGGKGGKDLPPPLLSRPRMT